MQLYITTIIPERLLVHFVVHCSLCYFQTLAGNYIRTSSIMSDMCVYVYSDPYKQKLQLYHNSVRNDCGVEARPATVNLVTAIGRWTPAGVDLGYYVWPQLVRSELRPCNLARCQLTRMGGWKGGISSWRGSEIWLHVHVYVSHRSACEKYYYPGLVTVEVQVKSITGRYNYWNIWLRSCKMSKYFCNKMGVRLEAALLELCGGNCVELKLFACCSIRTIHQCYISRDKAITHYQLKYHLFILLITSIQHHWNISVIVNIAAVPTGYTTKHAFVSIQQQEETRGPGALTLCLNWRPSTQECFEKL